MSQMNDELIDSIFNVANEKNLDVNSVMEAAEQSMEEVLSKAKGDIPIKVKINHDSGSINVYLLQTIVEEPTEVYEISLETAQSNNAELQLGDQVQELIESGSINSMPFMRKAASEFKKAFINKIQVLEKDREYEEFKDREGELIVAKVKRFEFNNMILDLKRGEGYLPANEVIPGETFRVNQEVKAYICEVIQDHKKHQITLSRSREDFLGLLFEETIPEINDKIFIKKIVRNPGSKAKVAVVSTDENVDPIGACIGKQGIRISAIKNEVCNERIDIIRWSDDKIELLVNAVDPAGVVKVIVRSENEVELIIKDDHVNKAIGSNGQNVKLASRLAECSITITSESDHEQEIMRIHQNAQEEFESINLDQEATEKLIENDIVSLEILRNTDEESIATILEIDNAAEIISNAEIQYLQKYQAASDEINSTISPDVDSRIGISEMQTLAEHGILTDVQLADSDADIMARLFNKFNYDESKDMIMKFRDKIYPDM